MLRLVLFDLDDTLYASASGLWPAIGQRINLYLIERLGLGSDAVAGLRQRYMETFGTTLNGLRYDYGIDAEDYLAFVHDLPLEQYLEPSPALGDMLARLPLRKVVFTNADAPHARRVLARLGVAQQFESIIDVHALNFLSKPDPRAYERALALTGEQPADCVFVDDAVRNLRPAHALGMATGLVSAVGGTVPSGVDFQIDSILELEAWLSSIDPSLSRVSSPVARQGQAGR
jgi:putative hydrolase of the HAD superfamily